MNETRINSLLETCIARPDLHVAWLNTLSLLEFTGARKIARSFRRPDDEILSHLAEEARHARFFATLAGRVAGKTGVAVGAAGEASPAVSETVAAKHRPTLGAASGLLYFHRLDHGIARDARARLAPAVVQRACYYHVTAAIEERALTLYHNYNDLLRKHETGLRLDGVIAEEEGHLEEMYRSLEQLDPESKTAIPQYRELEAKLFESFLAGLERELTSAAWN